MKAFLSNRSDMIIGPFRPQQRVQKADIQPTRVCGVVTLIKTVSLMHLDIDLSMEFVIDAGIETRIMLKHTAVKIS